VNVDYEYWLLKPDGTVDPYKLAILASVAFLVLYGAIDTVGL